MEYIMGDVILTINLPGSLKGPVAHTTRQVYTVDVTPLGGKVPLKMTRKIKHTDRSKAECVKRTRISEEVIKGFQSEENPYWVNAYVWKKLNKKQRLESYLERADEGYGYSYEYVESVNE